MRTTSKFTAFFISALITLSSSLYAGVSEDIDENAVTLAGHDVVAYFTEDKAVSGTSKFTASHHNAIYKFSSAANRDTFKKNPHKYTPVYGGFCAYGASVGKKFSVDGKAFKVVEGKLYVNKNLQVYDLWIQDIPGNIRRANRQWKIIKNIPASEL